MLYADQFPVPLGLPMSEPTMPTAPSAEAPLVARARARDVGAFEILYRTHVGRIFALCRRMTADARRAEELTQRAFIAAWEKLPHFRGESTFPSWLHRIAVNTVLADLRAEERRSRRVFGTDDPAAFETAPHPGSPPPGFRLDLENAIAALPPQARAVFVLHDIEGWDHAGIAAELGVTVGTTKAQLHRARGLLRQFLR